MPWRGSSQTLLTALAIAAISQSVSASSENTVPDSSGNCSSSVEISVDQRAEALDRWRHSRSIQRHGATDSEGSPRTGGSSKAANTETWRDRYRNLQTGMRDAFKKASSTVSADGLGDARFLVWSCRPQKKCAGLGNQLISMVAAFMLALMTERAFLIDYPGSLLHENLKSDFIDWRPPSGFLDWVQASPSPSLESGAVNGTRARVISGPLSRLEPDKLISCAEPVLWVQDGTYSFFLRDVWEFVMAGGGVGGLTREAMCAMGLHSVDETFAILGRFLFSSPIGQASERLSSLYALPLLSASPRPFVIGVQIRAGFRGLEGEPQRFRAEELDDVARRFSEAARRIELDHMPAGAQPVWVLATDVPGLKDAMLAGQDGPKIVHNPCTPAHVKDCDGDAASATGARARSVFGCALADWWMLGQVNASVIRYVDRVGGRGRCREGLMSARVCACVVWMDVCVCVSWMFVKAS